MDYRSLLSLSILIATVGITWHHIQPAEALPSGPSIALGSNPVAHSYTHCNGNNVVALTNGTTHDFIVTDIITYSGSAKLYIDGGYVLCIDSSYNPILNLHTGFVVPSGTSLTCNDNSGYPEVTVMGYYIHS